jgi:Ni,Fe-hydrogenase III small subunit
VTAGNEFDLAAYTREQLTRRASFDLDASTGHATFRQEESLPGPSLSESAEALKARIHGRFGRSLHVRQVDAGSCNGCELEIAATANPVFDLERFGIHFVASPRHADLLLVTGPVTRNMEIALLRTLEATPEPRVVVAVGACGCTGGIFGEGTYASRGGVDRVVPVDVYVPGCPPPPQAILAGLFVAMGIREARARPDGLSPVAGDRRAKAGPAGPGE